MTSVLVVRERDIFSRILEANGLPAINCPTVETFEVENLHHLPAKISAARYDGIFLTSRKAAEIVFREIFCQNFTYRGKVYVLGKSSFERLRDLKLDLFYDAAANTAREMLAAIPPAELANKRFLFVRGDRSLGTVREFLEKRATLDELVVYETRVAAVDEALKNEIETKASRGEIGAACFFSPSGAESFLEQLGAEVLRQTKIAAIGKTTADFLEKRNLKADFTPSKATAEDFANELIDYLKSPKSQVPEVPSRTEL